MATARGETGLPTAQDNAKVADSVKGREQAPSSRQLTAANENWQQVQNALGQPFSIERIPLSKLRLMRRDPMIGFGMNFLKTPLVKAPWYIDAKDTNGPNAQVAGFIDAALRPIYARLVFQYCLALDFGFQGIVKRFEQRIIGETYIDPNVPDSTPQPVWPDGTPPIVWKTFTPLPPEGVEPIWDGQGDFNGMLYTPPAGSTGGGSREKQMKIDLAHSLWVTNELDSVWGNIYGYPRTGYAYQYWWSYWHNWALRDRHFEKDADPPLIVRYPEGFFIDETTQAKVSNADIALDIGDAARSNSTIGLPSTPYTSFDDRASAQAEWDMKFLEGGGNFEAFNNAFQYLDVLKLRAVWIPEQALVEGAGGQSSRNVAEQFGNALEASQSVLMAEIDERINRFLIPDLLAANFPDFEGTAHKRTQAFASEDMGLLQQFIQLIGQSDSTQIPLDVREAMRRLNMPILSQEAQAQIATAASQPPVLEAVPGAGGTVGTVPTPGLTSPGPGAPGAATTGGPGTASGFSYVQPRERIYLDGSTLLADAGAEFLAELPATPHYSDPTLRNQAVELWRSWRQMFDTTYSGFSAWLLQQEDSELKLSEEEEADLELSDSKARRIAKKLLGNWTGESEKLNAVVTSTRDLFGRMFDRASNLALRGSNLSADVSSNEANTAKLLDRHLSTVATKAADTTRGEIEDFLTAEIAGGETDPRILASKIKDHFAGFPDWRANRLARTEVRDVFNMATLVSGRAAGVEQAQALDAQHGPTDNDCEDRAGQIFSIDDALRETEHPNGTLAWRLLPNVSLSVERTRDADLLASYDPDSHTVMLSDEITSVQERSYMCQLGEWLTT